MPPGNGHPGRAMVSCRMSRKKVRVLPACALVGLLVFSVPSCKSRDAEELPDIEEQELVGTVRISPAAADITVGTPLTATYEGPELGVGFRWNPEGKRIAGPSALEATYTPKASGSHTATAVLPGFRPKTGDPVQVGPSPAEE